MTLLAPSIAAVLLGLLVYRAYILHLRRQDVSVVLVARLQRLEAEVEKVSARVDKVVSDVVFR